MKVVLYSVLLVLLVHKSTSLSCYQCGIGTQPECEVDPDTNNLKPCPADENNYCVFANASYNYFYTAQRFCSASKNASCSRVPTPSGFILQQSCFSSTCNLDGCNSSSSINLSVLLLVMVVITSFLRHLID